MFAGRGITLPGFLISAAVIVGAFVLGVGAGWFTASLPGIVEADPSPSPSPSASTLLDPSVQPSLPPLTPITRALTQEDRDAGVVTTEVPVKGEGTLSAVPGVGTPEPNAGDVRWVSVAIEDGVRINSQAFRGFVMDTLNDNRAWGSGGVVQYVPTDGVADYRVILASPFTAAALCPDPHTAVVSGPVVPVSPSPSAQASAAPSIPPAVSGATAPDGAAVDLCGEPGVIVVSVYDWTAGMAGYGDDYTGSRQYQLLHRLGHLAGNPDVACAGPRAAAMVNQDDELPEGCAPNPWPFPDAPVDEPEPTASPAPGVG